ncbi:hypothetical protein TIFTF001_012897 [Ficus carica]|uniref:tRNA intron endonuclease N-terminal domain-containing protein n=1 Tax=Ficus carica TaxID=3494 RepID=A0AA88A140_FICCA|nr:hypothetical protein TIFTF001_012897 [Ficus carica]
MLFGSEFVSLCLSQFLIGRSLRNPTVLALTAQYSRRHRHRRLPYLDCLSITAALGHGRGLDSRGGSMGPRWKGKGSAGKVLGDPMSKIVFQLQSSLLESEAQALLSGSNALLVAEPQQADLLNRACFGVPISTFEKDKQWFQLGMEEAFYLSHSLKCLNILDKDKRLMIHQQLWHVDFVAYRHHPALVHSEFAVLVLSGGDGDANENERLRVWSDVHCTARLCSGVVKTFLVFEIGKNGHGVGSPSCLEEYSVGFIVVDPLIVPECHKSGCCKPPAECGYTYVDENYSSILASLRKSWRKISVIKIVVLNILEIFYVIGRAAFRSSRWIDNDKVYGEARMTKAQPSRIHI